MYLVTLQLFVAVNDSSSRQIVGRHFHCDPVTWQNPDVVHPHFARDGGRYDMVVFKTNPEHGI